MTHSNSNGIEPQIDDIGFQEIIGKRLLVGITRRNHADEITGYEQIHGTIIRASQSEGIIIRLNDDEKEQWLPPDLTRLQKAKPGEYRLKTTGEIVVDPDFLATWTVYPPTSH
jgi:hypothetical protein